MLAFMSVMKRGEREEYTVPLSHDDIIHFPYRSGLLMELSSASLEDTFHLLCGPSSV